MNLLLRIGPFSPVKMANAKKTSFYSGSRLSLSRDISRKKFWSLDGEKKPVNNRLHDIEYRYYAKLI